MTITFRTNRRWMTQDVESYSFGTCPPPSDPPMVATGAYLPSGIGFPYLFQEPYPSFKVLRALQEYGLSHTVTHVMRNFKRSRLDKDNVWNGVLKFGGEKRPRWISPHYSEALEWLRKEIRADDKIPIYTYDDAAEHIPKNTSPGLPFINTHKGKKKGDILEKFDSKFQRYWSRVGDALPVTPMDDCAAFCRSHISKPEVNKVRPVWAYPIKAIYQEAVFAQPILRALINQDIGHNTAYGMEMLKGGMTWLHHSLQKQKARDPGCKIFLGDYSAFDSSVPAWMIRDVFSIISEKLDFSRDNQGNQLNPERERRKFRKVVDYFINTPIRNTDGRRFLKDHGIPSGSMFTNIMGTFVNQVVMRCLFKVTMGKLPAWINCFGDDSVVVLPHDTIMDIKALVANAKTLFGMELNLKKSYWTHVLSNVHYLGYYNFHGAPVKSHYDLVASMIWPQYMRDDWAYCISRALGCMLASAGCCRDTFLAGQAVYFKARRESLDNIDRGLQMLQDEPRSRRHLDQMGCGEWNINEKFFFNQDACFPRLNCTKILKGI